ncbi:MAG: PilZ domain-containing protein [Planctomycetes bacterium]|nr:PilZ domain-containing protein [Planctomycetota bacterium]
MRLAVRPEFRGRRAKLVDISTGGIGFLLESALDAGTVMVFEIQATQGGETFTRIARVRHCRAQPIPPDAPWLEPKPGFSNTFRRLFGFKQPPPDGIAWLVGCEFDHPLTEDEIQSFLAHLKSMTFRQT